MANLREDSRKEWASGGTLNTINSGSLQRISDATEKMAASYNDLMNNRDMYRCWYERELAAKESLARRVIALRGVITKLKAKLQGGEK